MDYYNETYLRTDKTTDDIISLDDMKLYLKVDDDADDDLITALINAAVVVAERVMNRDLLTATYIRYSDTISQDLTLRRGGFYELDDIEYMVDGSYNSVDSDDYEAATDGIFAELWRVNIDESYDEHPQAIKITFKAGYGATATDIPDDIINALKAHVAFMYENRGDCGDQLDSLNFKLPATSALIYRCHKIIDINGII